MFRLDEQSKSPKYIQLIEKIKELIISRAIKTDEKMPSIRELSKEIRINPNTIQKSYHELEKQGYLYSLKGKGYYVAPVEVILIEGKIENELKPHFFRLLQMAKYLGLTKKEIIGLLEEMEWDSKRIKND